MKKIVLSLIAANAMLMAGGNIGAERIVAEVIAEDAFTGVYVGGALTGVSTGLDEGRDISDIFDNDTSTFGGQGNIGFTFFNDAEFALSAEARIGTNFTEDGDVELSYVSGYVKPEGVFGDFSIYGLIGYGTVEYNANSRISLSADTDVEDFTWGFGTQWLVAENISVFADYVALPSLDLRDTNLINEDSIDTDVISVGMNYRF